ncbi:hypothetical protein BDZ91DRAFT_748689 [Kalaharituber pfeilii]|nr:hypothetical protein BDZ91DRAFT_748689 [Kalaharituber pfeilii]
MQFFTLSLLTALAAIPAALAAPQVLRRTTVCDGNLVCCSQGLQGNVAYYCGSGPITEEYGCDMVTVCCAKDATKDLTPRGYTWTGCSMPVTQCPARRN